MSRAKFSHEPLDHKKKSIRVLRILPTLSKEGLIQCEIFHTTIRAPYQCLSYRWGDPDPEHEVLLNGGLFQVRQILFDFLALRQKSISGLYPDPTQTLWIDALCIDQANVDERNHQVAQMGAIFQGAIHVNVWLGRCPKLQQTLREHKPRTSEYVGTIQTDGTLSLLLSHLYDLYSEDSAIVETKQKDRSTSRSIVKEALRKEFFRNEYWTRAWITQEIYVARQVILVFEDEEFLMATLIKTIQRCDEIKVYHDVGLMKLAHFLGCSDRSHSRIRLGGTSDDLLGLLRHFSDRNCSIPRDRLYSILALYSEAWKLKVDYDEPDDVLVCRLVQHIKEASHKNVGMCLIAHFARILCPRSPTLGDGFIEFVPQQTLLPLLTDFEQRLRVVARGDVQDYQVFLAHDIKSQPSAPKPQSMSPSDLEKLLTIDFKGFLSDQMVKSVLGQAREKIAILDEASEPHEVLVSRRMHLPTFRVSERRFSRATKFWTSQDHGSNLCIQLPKDDESRPLIRISVALIWDALQTLAQNDKLCAGVHNHVWWYGHSGRQQLCKSVNLGCGIWTEAWDVLGKDPDKLEEEAQWGLAAVEARWGVVDTDD